VSQFLDFLDANPRLVHIHLGDTTIEDDGESDRIVTLPNLQILNLIKFAPHKEVLSHLFVPSAVQMIIQSTQLGKALLSSLIPPSLAKIKNLRRIEKISINDPHYQQFPTLRVSNDVAKLVCVSFALDSNQNWLHPIQLTNVREVWIHMEPFKREDARQLFNSLPSLEVLHLIQCMLPPGFFLPLHPAEGGTQPLCPNLSELRLMVSDETRCQWGELVDLARARKTGGVPLQKVFVKSKRMQKKSVAAPLRELVEFVEYSQSQWKVMCPF